MMSCCHARRERVRSFPVLPDWAGSRWIVSGMSTRVAASLIPLQQYFCDDRMTFTPHTVTSSASSSFVITGRSWWIPVHAAVKATSVGTVELVVRSWDLPRVTNGLFHLSPSIPDKRPRLFRYSAQIGNTRAEPDSVDVQEA